MKEFKSIILGLMFIYIAYAPLIILAELVMYTEYKLTFVILTILYWLAGYHFWPVYRKLALKFI